MYFEQLLNSRNQKPGLEMGEVVEEPSFEGNQKLLEVKGTPPHLSTYGTYQPHEHVGDKFP